MENFGLGVNKQKILSLKEENLHKIFRILKHMLIGTNQVVNQFS